MKLLLLSCFTNNPRRKIFSLWFLKFFRQVRRSFCFDSGTESREEKLNDWDWSIFVPLSEKRDQQIWQRSFPWQREKMFLRNKFWSLELRRNRQSLGVSHRQQAAVFAIVSFEMFDEKRFVFEQSENRRNYWAILLLFNEIIHRNFYQNLRQNLSREKWFSWTSKNCSKFVVAQFCWRICFSSEKRRTNSTICFYFNFEFSSQIFDQTITFDAPLVFRFQFVSNLKTIWKEKRFLDNFLTWKPTVCKAFSKLVVRQVRRSL